MKLLHTYQHKIHAAFSHTNGMDSKKTFLDNIKKYPDSDCLKAYLDKPLVYKTNNYGFRSPDDIVEGFDGNVYLGCSHTWGVGHYAENVWVNLLNKKIGGKCLNLGVPGSGIATGVRLMRDLVGKIKPKNVFIHYIHPYRFEFFDWKGKYWRTISPNYDYAISRPSSDVPDLMKRFLIQEEFASHYYAANFALLKECVNKMGAKLHSIKYIHLPAKVKPGKLPSDFTIPYHARDLLHYTTVWHQDVANRFYKAYTNDEPIVEYPVEEIIEIENAFLKYKSPNLFSKDLL
jgi:hypothetical protein